MFEQIIAAHNLPTFVFESPSVNEHGEVSARQEHSAHFFSENLGGGVRLEMVLVPGDLFLMGSPAGQGFADEHPQHIVRVAPFLLGKYPVTQEQWETVLGKPPL